MTSGVWCATSDARPSFQSKISTKQMAWDRLSSARYAADCPEPSRPRLFSVGRCFLTSASSADSAPGLGR